MTAGHKHKIIWIKDGGLFERTMRYPLLKTRNKKWVNKSILVFGLVDPPVFAGDEQFYLSALGILHGWTGLTLFTGTKDEYLAALIEEMERHERRSGRPPT